MNLQDDYWVKYLKKGKVFARHCKFSSFEDGKLTIITTSVRRNSKIVQSKIIIPFCDLIFIGNKTREQIVYLNKKYMSVVND